MVKSLLSAPLEDLCESVDYGHTASAEWAPVGPRFLRITDIQDGAVAWTTVPYCACSQSDELASSLLPGDILFARTGATTGKSFLIRRCPDRAVFASYLIRIRPNSSVVDPVYLAHYFQTQDYWDQIKSSARGATLPGVNSTVLKSLRIPLLPMYEQRRIAAILDKADALRQKRRTALQKLDSLTQSLFLDMFGDPVANPNRWPMVRFGSIAECKLGKMLDGGRQTGLAAYPYLRNANVQWNRLNLDSLFEMDFDESDRERFSLKPGDLLICEGGEPGRAAIWDGELARCYYQKALHRCRVAPTQGVGKFFVFLLWELSKRSSLRFSTSTIAHLTAEKLDALMVPNPPLILQQDFVIAVSAAERQAKAHARAEAKLEALIASLQHRAFRGEL